MKRIQTHVLIETCEVFAMKRKRSFDRTWCEDCKCEVNVASITDAAMLSGLSAETIYSMVENRHIHFSCIKKDTPVVCLRSLCLF